MSTPAYPNIQQHGRRLPIVHRVHADSGSCNSPKYTTAILKTGLCPGLSSQPQSPACNNHLPSWSTTPGLLEYFCAHTAALNVNGKLKSAQQKLNRCLLPQMVRLLIGIIRDIICPVLSHLNKHKQFISPLTKSSQQRLNSRRART